MSNKIPMAAEEAPASEQASDPFWAMRPKADATHEFASFTDPSLPFQQDTSALVRDLLKALHPKTKYGRICRSIEWAEEDDLLLDLIELKCDFAVVGCVFHAADDELADLEDQLKLSNGKSYSTEVEDGSVSDTEKKRLLDVQSASRFARNVQSAWDLTPIVRQLLKDWFTCESMVLYWRVDVTSPGDTEVGLPPNARSNTLPQVLQLTALDPRCCNYDDSIGNERLLYRLPIELRQKIERVLNTRDRTIREGAIKLLVDEGIPLDWIKAVEAGRSEVLLDHKLGDRWLVQTKGRRHCGFADPSMKTIFDALEMRKMIKQGEFSASLMMKHLILHAKMGESIDTGPEAGSRKNWATPKETEVLHQVLSRIAQSARLVTNHTVTFDFVFPPKEIFDPAKYGTCEGRIARWAGVTSVLTDGDGSTGSSGHLSVKKLIASLIYARDRVRYIFSQFFADPTIAESAPQGIAEGISIRPKFDENVLKDARQLLDELKQLFAAHAIDPESMARELGRDPALIRQRKLSAIIDNQVTGVYRPIHEAPFGGFPQNDDSGTKVGRPANEGTTTDDDTRNQPPITK